MVPSERASKAVWIIIIKERCKITGNAYGFIIVLLCSLQGFLLEFLAANAGIMCAQHSKEAFGLILGDPVQPPLITALTSSQALAYNITRCI